MKKLLLFTLLLNFTFVCFTFAQDESDEFFPIRNERIINLFDDIRNKLEKEPNFDKIDTDFLQKISNHWSDTNKLDKDLYLITHLFDTDKLFYIFQFTNYKNKVVAFNCTFSLSPLIKPIRRDSSFTQERQLGYLNHLFKVHFDNKGLELNEKEKSVSYHKSYIENLEEYQKINPKVTINYKFEKVISKTDKAIDFLVNQESFEFIFNSYNFSSCEFEESFEYISFLINNKKVQELEKMIYTLGIRGKLLAAGAILYLQKNEGILLNSEIEERLDYILENEEKVEVRRSNGDCKAYNNLDEVYLAKDFEILFEKYGTKVIQKKSNNDVQER